jgi:protein TonB
MQEKKSPKGNLEKKRTTFLIIGFVIALGLIYACFELFATLKNPINLGSLGGLEIIEIVENIPNTDQTPPPPPPPTPQPDILNIVGNEVKVNTEGIIPTEYNESDEVPPYEPIPIIGEEIAVQPPERFPEKMPEPLAGFNAVYAFLKSNLKYPEIPRKNGISGQVFVEFVIEKDGSISNVKVLAGVHPELDQEAMRVVKMMPKWRPGEQMGKTVRCLYNIPIRFTIN